MHYQGTDYLCYLGGRPNQPKVLAMECHLLAGIGAVQMSITKAMYRSASSPNIRSLVILLLPTGSEERGVSGVGSIPVAILPSCQDMKTIVL